MNNRYLTMFKKPPFSDDDLPIPEPFPACPVAPVPHQWHSLPSKVRAREASPLMGSESIYMYICIY